MRAKFFKVVSIGVLGAAVALAVTLIIISHNTGSIKDKIINACKESDETNVLLSDFTDFEWDMCIVYTSKAQTKDIQAFDINYDTVLDLNNGIVFANGKEVVYEEQFNVLEYTFNNKIPPFDIYPYRENAEEQIKCAEFSKDNAKFKCVKKTSGKDSYYRLYPDV